MTIVYATLSVFAEWLQSFAQAKLEERSEAVRQSQAGADIREVTAAVPGMLDDEAVLDEAAKLAAKFEGFSSTPYLCPAKVWTIGFGSTRTITGERVTQNTPAITREEARQWMEGDLAGALGTVKHYVTAPLETHEAAALTDFVYNVGSGNFANSTLLRKLNEGDRQGAIAEFPRWNRGGGKVLPGLIRRRAAEASLFSGQPEASV